MLILCTGLVIAFFDQWTKVVVQKKILLGDQIAVIPDFFNLSYVQNTGAAYGMFQGLSQWLVLLSVIMLIAIVVFRRYFIRDTMACHFAVGLMVGGIWGNLLDRVRLDYVVDFLDFYVGQSHFPSFNVADSAICVGVGLYILLQFLDRNNAAVPELEEQPQN